MSPHKVVITSYLHGCFEAKIVHQSSVLKPSLQVFPKSSVKGRRFASKSGTTNEPPLGGHIVHEKKKTTKNKITTPWPKARKNHEFALQIHVFPGLRPRGGQITDRLQFREKCQNFTLYHKTTQRFPKDKKIAFLFK